MKVLECPDTIPVNIFFLKYNPQRVSDKVCDYAGRYEYRVDGFPDSLSVAASSTSSRDEIDVTGYFCQGQRSPKRREHANPQRPADGTLVTTWAKITGADMI